MNRFNENRDDYEQKKVIKNATTAEVRRNRDLFDQIVKINQMNKKYYCNQNSEPASKL